MMGRETGAKGCQMRRYTSRHVILQHTGVTTRGSHARLRTPKPHISYLLDSVCGVVVNARGSHLLFNKAVAHLQKRCGAPEHMVRCVWVWVGGHFLLF